MRTWTWSKKLLEDAINGVEAEHRDDESTSAPRRYHELFVLEHRTNTPKKSRPDPRSSRTP
jgi:hypothetical protein